jgi:hypothetical protein
MTSASNAPQVSDKSAMLHHTADEQRVHSLILELTSSNDREHALSELSKIRESFDNLALLLWHSFGISCLLFLPMNLLLTLFARRHDGVAARGRSYLSFADATKFVGECLFKGL